MPDLTRMLPAANSWPFRNSMALLTALLIATLFSSPVTAQFWKRDKPYADGTKILITGVVSDLSGKPLDNLEVVLTAKRYSYKVSRLQQEVERKVDVSTTTNERGEYTITWIWYRYYNDFVLEAGVQVPTGTDTFRTEVLARTELNNRIALGSPVIVPLTVTDPTFLNTFRDFLAHLDSEDEKRVYRTQGRPDKIDALDLSDRSEEAWWFFERGQVYRFIDGRLDQVENFDAIQP